MGKNKPIYDPSTDCGDYVVVVGCHDLHTTGKKRLQKQYYTHTTRPGSLKSMSMDQMFAKWGGGEVLRRAVKGMLPKNRLQKPRLARLKSELLALDRCLLRFFKGAILTNDIYLAAFEGLAHPYNENIVKFGNESVLGHTTEFQEAFQSARESS